MSDIKVGDWVKLSRSGVAIKNTFARHDIYPNVPYEVYRVTSIGALRLVSKDDTFLVDSESGGYIANHFVLTSAPSEQPCLQEGDFTPEELDLARDIIG